MCLVKDALLIGFFIGTVSTVVGEWIKRDSYTLFCSRIVTYDSK